MLSAFGRSAVALPALQHLAGEVGRAIGPRLGEEGFVTAVLAQISPGGELTIVNCGHHRPLARYWPGDPGLTCADPVPWSSSITGILLGRSAVFRLGRRPRSALTRRSGRLQWLVRQA